MVAVLFLGGVQLLCVGLQGLYIGSIFQESKRRPNYTLASVTNKTPVGPASAGVCRAVVKEGAATARSTPGVKRTPPC